MDKQELELLELYERQEQEGTEQPTEEQLKELLTKFLIFGVLGKLYNVVVHIYSSPQRLAKFLIRAK